MSCLTWHAHIPQSPARLSAFSAVFIASVSIQKNRNEIQLPFFGLGLRHSPNKLSLWTGRGQGKISTPWIPQCLCSAAVRILRIHKSHQRSDLSWDGASVTRGELLRGSTMEPTSGCYQQNNCFNFRVSLAQVFKIFWEFSRAKFITFHMSHLCWM